MENTVVPSLATSLPATPVATAAPVVERPALTLDGESAAPPVAPAAPATVDPDASERISLQKLAKASREAREARQRAATLEAEANDLKAKLTAATEEGGKVGEAKIQEIIDAIKANPRLLRDKHGLSFQAVLDAYTGDEAPAPDPKLTQAEQDIADLKKWREDQAKAATEAEEAAKVAGATAAEAEYTAGVSKLIADEGVKPAADGTKRWVLVAKDAGAAAWARATVGEYLKGVRAQDAEAGRPPTQVTEAQAIHLTTQALDQLEASHRKALGDSVTIPRVIPVIDKKQSRFQELQNTSRQELVRPDPKPTIDSSVRGGLPIATKKSPMNNGPRKLGIPI